MMRQVSPVIVAAFAALAIVSVGISSPARAGDKDVLYVHGTHPPAIDGETLGLNDASSLGYSSFRDAIVDEGFTLTEFEAGPGSSATLTPTLLSNYKVVILSSNNRNFSAAEATAVNNWVNAGGGLVAFSDAAFGRDQNGDGDNDADDAGNNTGIPNTLGADSDNSLTQQFGMQFLRDSANGVYTAGLSNTDYQFEDFLWTNDPGDGVIRFKGEGVSPIKVSGPAQVLLRFTDTQRGDGSSNPALNSADTNDGINLDQTIAALAVAQIGSGRVIGTFDRNTFFNDGGPGTDLTEADNEQFARNLVLYASGVPEPTTLAVLAFATPLLLRRRR
ncbi:MAG: hypothetical protein GVY24_07685 [Planctomycetes bacterium]|jgi:hypothetical protein|nr:hypothetical protein [Planctomycetota bacterium]